MATYMTRSAERFDAFKAALAIYRVGFTSEVGPDGLFVVRTEGCKGELEQGLFANTKHLTGR